MTLTFDFRVVRRFFFDDTSETKPAAVREPVPIGKSVAQLGLPASNNEAWQAQRLSLKLSDGT
jgi:hypothetical protein